MDVPTVSGARLDVIGLTDQAASTLSSRGLTRVGTLLTTFSPGLIELISRPPTPAETAGHVAAG